MQNFRYYYYNYCHHCFDEYVCYECTVSSHRKHKCVISIIITDDLTSTPPIFLYNYTIVHIRDTQSHSGRLVFWLPTSAHVTIEDVRDILNQTEASVRNPLWRVIPIQQLILQYTMINYSTVSYSWQYRSSVYDTCCAILCHIKELFIFTSTDSPLITLTLVLLF